MIADLIAQGGPVMYALSGCSLVAVAIILDRAWFWVREAKDDCGAFLRSVVTEEGGVCSSAQIEEVVQAAQALSSRQKIAGRLTQESERLYERAIRNLSGLDTVVSIAPLLGILGTVMGMIQAFYDMSNAGNNIDVTLLSTGIYQAMVTTVAGLIVGIIAYFAYNILVSNVEKVVFKMEATTSDFMDLLNEPA